MRSKGARKQRGIGIAASLALMALCLFLPRSAWAGSGQIIKSNGPNTGTNSFSAPGGQYISHLKGYWSGGWGYITAPAQVPPGRKQKNGQAR